MCTPQLKLLVHLVMERKQHPQNRSRHNFSCSGSTSQLPVILAWGSLVLSPFLQAFKIKSRLTLPCYYSMSSYKIDVKAWIDWALHLALSSHSTSKMKNNQNNHMTPKLILVMALPCNGGKDGDKVSCAMKEQLHCLPMPEVATPASVTVVMAWGPGGCSRVLCLQTVLSFMPMEKAASSAAASPAWRCTGVQWQW